MKFIADECCDAGLIESLRAHGFDVLYIIEKKTGITDKEILDKAFKTGRILLTEDKDFGELVYRLKIQSRGIVLIRIGIKNRHLKWNRLKKLLDHYQERLPGSFVVVEERKFRFRPIIFEL